MRGKAFPRADWLAAGILWTLTLAVFGAGAGRLGFYADDGGWLVRLSAIRAGQMWDVMRHYMPGRNLHPLWHYLVYRMVGDPFGQLPMLHLIQSALDGLVVAAFFLLLRLLGLPGFTAWTAAGLFAFWPFHGETHFWLEAMPMNLLSTLWLLGAIATSVMLLRGRRDWWVWALDFTAFGCALFTYDQVLPLLAALLVIRIFAMRWSPTVWAHLPYAAALSFMVWLRLSEGGGPIPRSGGLAHVVLENVRDSALRTFGPPAIEQAAFLNRHATTPDRQLTLAVALILAGGVWLLWRRPAPAPAAGLLPPALSFWLLAYLPIWLWWPAPRHHYLPSVGMFAAGAVVLAWLGARFPAGAVRAMAAVAVGATTFLTATACRGESRLWERSFVARREMFTELRPRLPGTEVIVLEDFPFLIGPAYFVTPQDPECWVHLLTRDEARHGHLLGALSSAPAPGGVFINTAYGDGPPAFDYVTTSKFLVVRFTGWHGEQAAYAINPAALPYEMTPVTEPGPGNPGISQITARRDGPDLLVSFFAQGDASAAGHLTAIISFRQEDRWQHWGRRNIENFWIAQPVILSSPGWTGQLRLHEFPPADQVQVELYRSLSGHNELLGRAEAAVSP
jgi:hypothetical protein